MIPTDLSTRLRLIQDSQVQAPTAAAEIASELPAYALGQRISARITGVQADGVFRAEVEGRTLNLKVAVNNPGEPVEQLRGIGVGQTLDLVVTGKSGRNILARLPDQAAAATSVLSKPAQIIGNLLARGAPQPAALAKGAPLMEATSPEAFRGLPQQLRQAVSESGLFYESHQAEWVAGRLPATALLKEPQGSFSAILSNPITESASPTTQPTNQPAPAAATTTGPPSTPVPSPTTPGQATPAATTSSPFRPAMTGMAPSADTAELHGLSPAASPAAGVPFPLPDGNITTLPFRLLQGALLYQAEQERWPSDNTPMDEGDNLSLEQPLGTEKFPAKPNLGDVPTARSPHSPAGEATLSQAAQKQPLPGDSTIPAATLLTRRATDETLPTQLEPLVQQQLDAADSGQMIWHGQIWPGQDMEWRIEQEGRQHAGDGDQDDQQWKTSLRLTLPHLGQVNASIALSPSGVTLKLASDQGDTLRQAAPELAHSLEAAGVPVLSLSVVGNEQT